MAKHAGRLGDSSHRGGLAPSVTGSATVLINRKPALRLGDKGRGSSGTWVASAGSATVLIDGRRAHRQADGTQHHDGAGALAQRSSNVIIGDSGAAKVRKQDRQYLDLQYRYVDGEGVPNAKYGVECGEGSMLAAGTLDAEGFARVEFGDDNRLELAIVYHFHDDPGAYEVRVKPVPNEDPWGAVDGLIYGFPDLMPLACERPSEDAQRSGTGESGSAGGGNWLLGVLLGDFKKDPSLSQTVANTIITLFPVVDQVGDVRDLIANIYHLIRFYICNGEPGDEEFWLWVSAVITVIGCIPEFGTAIKGVFRSLVITCKKSLSKLERLHVYKLLTSILNHVGKGNAFVWLRKLSADCKLYVDMVAGRLRGCFDLIRQLLDRWLFIPARQQITDAIEKARKRLPSMVEQVFDWCKSKLDDVLLDPIEKRPGRLGSLNEKVQEAFDPHLLDEVERELKTWSESRTKTFSANVRRRKGKIQTNKVYLRDDKIDPRRLDKQGRTNLERMREGLAPFGPDGKKIELHHLIQMQDFAIAEIEASFHEKYYKVLHIDVRAPSQINRPEFDPWRKAYWKERAKDFE